MDIATDLCTIGFNAGGQQFRCTLPKHSIHTAHAFRTTRTAPWTPPPLFVVPTAIALQPPPFSIGETLLCGQDEPDLSLVAVATLPDDRIALFYEPSGPTLAVYRASDLHTPDEPTLHRLLADFFADIPQHEWQRPDAAARSEMAAYFEVGALLRELVGLGVMQCEQSKRGYSYRYIGCCAKPKWSTPKTLVCTKRPRHRGIHRFVEVQGVLP